MNQHWREEEGLLQMTEGVMLSDGGRAVDRYEQIMDMLGSRHNFLYDSAAAAAGAAGLKPILTPDMYMNVNDSLRRAEEEVKRTREVVDAARRDIAAAGAGAPGAPSWMPELPGLPSSAMVDGCWDNPSLLTSLLKPPDAHRLNRALRSACATHRLAVADVRDEPWYQMEYLVEVLAKARADDMAKSAARGQAGRGDRLTDHGLIDLIVQIYNDIPEGEEGAKKEKLDVWLDRKYVALRKRRTVSARAYREASKKRREALTAAAEKARQAAAAAAEAAAAATAERRQEGVWYSRDNAPDSPSARHLRKRRPEVTGAPAAVTAIVPSTAAAPSAPNQRPQPSQHRRRPHRSRRRSRRSRRSSTNIPRRSRSVPRPRPRTSERDVPEDWRWGSITKTRKQKEEEAAVSEVNRRMTKFQARVRGMQTRAKPQGYHQQRARAKTRAKATEARQQMEKLRAKKGRKKCLFGLCGGRRHTRRRRRRRRRRTHRRRKN